MDGKKHRKRRCLVEWVLPSSGTQTFLEMRALKKPFLARKLCVHGYRQHRLSTNPILGKAKERIRKFRKVVRLSRTTDFSSIKEQDDVLSPLVSVPSCFRSLLPGEFASQRTLFFGLDWRQLFIFHTNLSSKNSRLLFLVTQQLDSSVSTSLRAS